MLDPDPLPKHRWLKKFRNALRGMKEGVRGQSSFFVHFFLTAAVIVAAAVLQVTLAEWCILLLCVTVVLTVEMFNSALESMAKAINDEADPYLGNSLDIGSGAVLVASIGAAVVGCIVFINRLRLTLNLW